MPFSAKNITNIGGADRRGTAPLIFAYNTTDALTAVAATGYFNDHWDKMLPGDIIFVSVVTFGADDMPGEGGAGKPTAAAGVGQYLVTAVNGATKVVTIAAI